MLSDEERNRLMSFLAERPLSEQPNDETYKPDTHRLLEVEWLKQHRSEYEGQYVALDGDRLVSHGPDGKKVYAEARQAGVDVPYIVRIEGQDEPPFGGW